MLNSFGQIRLFTRNCQGFTLLEVIVALGIVSVGILGVSRAMSGHITTLNHTEQRVLAYWVASNQLESLRIAGTQPIVGTVTGNESMGGRSWYYQQQTQPTADPLLFRIDVKVFSDVNSEEAVGEMFGYLLKQP